MPTVTIESDGRTDHLDGPDAEALLESLRKDYGIDVESEATLNVGTAPETVRCHRGHESDRRLWNCPVCTDHHIEVIAELIQSVEGQGVAIDELFKELGRKSVADWSIVNSNLVDANKAIAKAKRLRDASEYEPEGRYVVEMSSEYNAGGPIIAIEGSHPIAVMFVDWDCVNDETRAAVVAEAQFLATSGNIYKGEKPKPEALAWLKKTCPICGETFDYREDYEPKTCNKSECQRQFLHGRKGIV